MRHNLWIGPSYSLSWVLILAFLTKPSFPGYVAMTRANLHFDLLWFGSTSKTRSSTWTFSVVRNHLFLGNKLGAKYVIQHFQNSLTRSCVLLRRCVTIWASFRVFRLSLICKGLNMSMAELEKGGKPAATRKDGICPINWSSGFLRSFLQVMHFAVRALDMLRTPMIHRFLLASWIKLL